MPSSGGEQRLQLLQLAGDDLRLLAGGLGGVGLVDVGERGVRLEADRVGLDDVVVLGEHVAPVVPVAPATGAIGVASSSPPQLRIRSTKTMKMPAIALSATRRLR